MGKAILKAIIMMLIVLTIVNKHWSYMDSKHCDLWRAYISQMPCDLIITPTVGTEDGGKHLDFATESWNLLASPWLGWPGADWPPEYGTGCHGPPGCISEGLTASISWSPGPPGKKSTPHLQDAMERIPALSSFLEVLSKHKAYVKLDILNQTGSQSPIWHHVKQKKCAVEPSLNPWPSKLWDTIKWNCFKTVGLGCGFKF